MILLFSSCIILPGCFEEKSNDKNDKKNPTSDSSDYDPPVFSITGEVNETGMLVDVDYEETEGKLKQYDETDLDDDDDLNSKTGGNAMDWCFKEFRIPSFMYEVYTPDYGSDHYSAAEKHVNLLHWMEKQFLFFMYLLVNIENLHNWETPDINP